FAENAVQGVEEGGANAAEDGKGRDRGGCSALQHLAYQDTAKESSGHAEILLHGHFFVEEQGGQRNHENRRHGEEHGGKGQCAVLDGFIVSEIDTEHSQNAPAQENPQVSRAYPEKTPVVHKKEKAEDSHRDDDPGKEHSEVIHAKGVKAADKYTAGPPHNA